ncbi:glucokinase [Chitinophaga sp. CF118]|uniref:glucokinase n=1 Tax=Chitinophaga sp. CF118 TaxID=1884367 RepID=UPI0008E403BB|nr:glucokinase [Chitinophaga sp. CF118]SFE44441.1 glucokinase [Chitinophaga sp. CF118]
MLIPLRTGKNDWSAQHTCTLLAGDIGGTKTNLALYNYDGKTFTLLKEDKYLSKDYNSLGKMLTDFLGDKVPDRMCFGVAGPVLNGKVKITNVPWTIDSNEIAHLYNNIPVHLINDLETTAYGLAVLEEKDLHTIHKGKHIPGNWGIIAPGTGLGEAGIYWDGKNAHPFPTEGGHCDFAPRTEPDLELFTYLQRKFGHVSWERLISGPGIFTIYEFLRDLKEMDAPAWLTDKMLVHDDAPALISENADTVPICAETMTLFLRYLAIEAANLALKVKATAGIFIGGGIMPKNLKLVDSHIFIKWFHDFGRMKHLLEDIPVKIILNDKTALLGAAWYAINPNE